MQFSSQGAHDFLISYAPADRLWAEWMGYVLEENGYSVFLAAWDIRPGNNALFMMHEALKEAKHILILISLSYMSTPNLIAEWTAAFQRQGRGEKNVLIPVLIQEYSLQGLLGPIRPINLIDLDELQSEQILLRDINFTRAKPAKPPLFPGSTTSSKQENITHFQHTESTQEPLFPQNYEPITRPINVCILCADVEEDLRLLRQFLSSLAPLRQQGVIQMWHVNEIKAGARGLEEIERQVELADMVLPLMSSDFFASERFVEVSKLMQTWDQRRGDGAVVPVLLRACDWQETLYARFRVLPERRLAITSWGNRDEAFTDVIRGIRGVVNQLVMKKRG